MRALRSDEPTRWRVFAGVRSRRRVEGP